VKIGVVEALQIQQALTVQESLGEPVTIFVEKVIRVPYNQRSARVPAADHPADSCVDSTDNGLRAWRGVADQTVQGKPCSS
jgi:hypothetical protein